MAGSSLPFKEFGRRFRKALSVPFLLNQVCSTNVNDFVTAYAASLGCTEKSFFFPLLTCAAACMGTECYAELSGLWHEPPIIWTLVITPKSLIRIDVAEHLKQELLKAQSEVFPLGQHEDTKDHLRKFVFDMFTLNQLHDMLKLSNGHGFAIYNSTRSLHKCVMLPEEIDIMFRLHSGLGWFSDSRVTRSTLSKTRVNLAIISTPYIVHQTLTSAPNFQELFDQCFLTTCSEENHVKFSQLLEVPETEKLREIFLSLIKLHSTNAPIIYKLSAEAREKFEQIHDELTDKAKQMARKNAHKVFQPALSYLSRLSCVLHVLDNVIDAINYKVPITHLTWNTEISATSVWHARELLGHVIEQRHALMEQTTIEGTVSKVARTPAIDLVGGHTPRIQRTPNTMPTLSANVTPRRTQIQSALPKSLNFPVNNVRRNIMTNNVNPSRSIMNNNISPSRNIMNNNISPSRNIMNNNVSPSRNIMNNNVNSSNNRTFDALLTQKETAQHIDPRIVSVCSAGLPVTNEETTFNPIISVCETVKDSSNNNLNAELNLPPSLSVSVSEEAEASEPTLLSRLPYTSVLDVTNDEFLRSHRSSVRKLLMHGIFQISASRCVQLKLTPDPTASDEAQKYTPSFARSFLKKLELLGFGVCDGPKNGNLRHFVFKKKKYSALNDNQLQILSELKISERDYNKCFVPLPVRKPQQNGSVVCLE